MICRGAINPPIEIVSKVILRHSNLATTQRYLGKVTDAEAIRWIENLYEYLCGDAWLALPQASVKELYNSLKNSTGNADNLVITSTKTSSMLKAVDPF